MSAEAVVEHRGRLPIVNTLLRWKDNWEVRGLRTQLREAARRIAEEAEIGIFAGQGPYVLYFDGNQPQAVERMRLLKGRVQGQAEATVLPPEVVSALIDSNTLRELNPDVTMDTISGLYQVHPVGLIVPCREEVVPNNFIIYRQVGKREIPTIMNVWHPKSYKILMYFWEEISRYPNVILAGTSANRSGLQQSPIYFKDARRNFPELTIGIKDPFEGRHFYQTSHTILNLIDSTVARGGSVDPERYPEQFQKFRDVLPNLVVSRE